MYVNIILNLIYLINVVYKNVCEASATSKFCYPKNVPTRIIKKTRVKFIINMSLCNCFLCWIKIEFK